MRTDPSIQGNFDYRLDDYYSKSSGRFFLTGTQLLVKLPLVQSALDAARGLNTAGFIAGYRGSPLGAYDQELWRAKKHLDAAGIRFLPAINEDLAVTAVLGSQQVECDPEKTVDGVFGIWYGKGPGVDRAGDALRHGNAYGSSPHGGVLVLMGDDHGCVSSSLPHQSDIALQAWGLPIIHPTSVAEYLEFGLYGWALSRFSGTWVGFKTISEVVESGATIDFSETPSAFTTPTDFVPPPGGLHYRMGDIPSLGIEARLAVKHDAVQAFARHNSIDKAILSSPTAEIGIVTCGKAHADLMESFRLLGLDLQQLGEQGIRIYKIGLAYPIETTRMLQFAEGLKEILVVEEKAPVVERQIKELLYNRGSAVVIGKKDAAGNGLLSSLGELRPSRVIPVVAEWLARHRPALDRRSLVPGLVMPKLLSNAADGVRRMPHFCSGCPHSTSTKLPDGSRALVGIGCHGMAWWMPERKASGAIQMGGEGVDWAAHALFTKTPHVFQNLGEGTYFHSGYMAIRQTIAAGTNITYKILFNNAVAMTGGQPVDGTLTVDSIARQMDAEGAKRVVVVSDDPDKYRGNEDRFPHGTTFHHRSEMDQLQRTLREIPGVTVLIYDQMCAAEKRRLRKRDAYPRPVRRMVINTAVCEGCGDCGQQSDCLSIVPVDTDLGRKRMIDQSSCNADYSCVNGFCPSFVSVYGGTLRRASRPAIDGERLRAAVDALPLPPTHDWSKPFNLIVAGVGGTGVVTVGALTTMAAHIEGKFASVLDFMGFAQKGGSVLSFVRLSKTRDLLNQVRVDTQQADAILACDMVVGASADTLQTVRHGRTVIVANSHEIQTAAFVRNPDTNLQSAALLEKMCYAAGDDQVSVLDAQALAEDLLGDTITSNILMMGFAWQRGLVPVSLESLHRAVELNGVAVEANKMAFAIGRLAAGAPSTLAELSGTPPKAVDDGENISLLIDRRVEMLTEYQDAAYAVRYRRLVDETRRVEEKVVDNKSPLRLTTAVARNFAKLLAYKDEYEVARLYTNGEFVRQLNAQFDGNIQVKFHMAPPVLVHTDADGKPPAKLMLGSWMWPVLRLLARLKGLRGGAFDFFGRSEDRKVERQLIEDYANLMGRLLQRLTVENLGLVVDIASVPEKIRGYGHVKASSIRSAKAHEQELLERLS